MLLSFGALIFQNQIVSHYGINHPQYKKIVLEISPHIPKDYIIYTNTLKIFDIENARQRYSKEIELLLTPDLSNDDILQKIVSLLEPHKNGKCHLTIKCISDKHIVPLNLNNKWLINPSSTLINSLSDLLGKENIIVSRENEVSYFSWIFF